LVGIRLFDVVLLSGLELHSATIIQEEIQELEVEVLFFPATVLLAAELSDTRSMLNISCPRDIKPERIIPQSEIKELLPSLGKGLLSLFKMSEKAFEECHQLGLKAGCKSDWEVVSHTWVSHSRERRKSICETWHQPINLLSIDGRKINHQVVRLPPIRKDAFARFTLEKKEVKIG
jgi:hypothetical protein